MNKELDFALGFDSGFTKDFVNRRCINLYRNVAESPSLSNAQLLGAIGTEEFADVGLGTCNGMFSTLGRLFVVYGSKLYEIDQYGDYTEMGDIGSTTTPVRFASNGYNMVLITSLSGYFFDLFANELTEIDDVVFTNYLPVLDVTYKDGRFFYINSSVIFQGSLVTDYGSEYVLAASATTSNTGWTAYEQGTRATNGTIMTFTNAEPETVFGGYYTFTPVVGEQYIFTFTATFAQPAPAYVGMEVRQFGNGLSIFGDQVYEILSLVSGQEYVIELSEPIIGSSVQVFFILATSAPVLNETFSIDYLNYQTTTGAGRGFNSLNFAVAETNPDGNVALHTSNNMAYVAGENTFEVYQSIESDGFTLQRIQGGTIQKGCVARDSVIDFMGGMTFLGRDNGETIGLYLLNGSQYKKITTPAIEYYIQTLTNAQISAAKCWAYQAQTGSFLVLDIGDATFVYDHETSVKTGRMVWHERQSGAINWQGFTPWRSIFSATCYGNIFVGDRESSKIGKLSTDICTEYNEKIAHGFTTQPFEADAVVLNEIKASVNVGGEIYNTVNNTVYFTAVTSDEAYDASPAANGVLSSSGRKFTVQSAASSLPEYMARSPKLVTLGTEETGVGFYISTLNDSYTVLMLASGGTNYGTDVGEFNTSFILEFDQSAGTMAITINNAADGVNNQTVKTIDYAGEKLFFSVLQKNDSCICKMYHDGEEIMLNVSDSGLPLDLYLLLRYASITTGDYYQFTIDNHPPYDKNLFVVDDSERYKTTTVAPFVYSKNIAISGDGYQIVGNADIDATADTRCSAWTDAITIESNQEYMVDFTFDAASVPAGKTESFFIYFVNDNINTQVAGGADGITIRFLYTESTGIMAVETTIDWLGASSTTSDTFTYTSGSTISVSFMSNTYENATEVWVRSGSVLSLATIYNALSGSLVSGDFYMYGVIVAGTGYTPDQSSLGAITISTGELLIPDALVFGETSYDDDTEPTMEMSYSIDGGRTFNTPQSRGLGFEGQYNKVVKWVRLGQLTTARVLRFFSDSKVKFAINKMEIDIDGNE